MKLTQEQQAELKSAKDIEPIDLIATTAYHQMGELTREEGDLCWAGKESENYYVGAWVTGFGFFNVMFPKETTRKLTDAEVEKYNNMYVQISSQPPIKLNVSNENIID